MVGAESELREAARAPQPAEPTCPAPPKPLALLDVFAATTLVFATDFLSRTGQLERSVFDAYWEELQALRPEAAAAYKETAHCSFSFLTDTTSMKLTQHFAEGLTADSLNNVILGQTVLPSWRKLEELGFSAERPSSAEEFARRWEAKCPDGREISRATTSCPGLLLAPSSQQLLTPGRSQLLGVRLPAAPGSQPFAAPSSLQPLPAPDSLPQGWISGSGLPPAPGSRFRRRTGLWLSRVAGWSRPRPPTSHGRS